MIVIEDDFYPNADEVREKALSMFFMPGVKGKKVMFAGQRSLGSFSAQNRLYCKNRLEKLINRKIILFPTNNSNCSFTLGKDLHGQNQKYRNWIHQDKGDHETERTKHLNSQMFAAVCYLTPNDIAPSLRYGTGLFTNVETGKNWATEGKGYGKSLNFSGEWAGEPGYDLHTYVGNMYNRIVVYPATYWHAPYNAGFGHDKYTGRLIQVFFFHAEKSGVERGYEIT